MSSNSEHQEEVIDILNESPTAQPFIFAHLDTNGPRYYSTGQTGNAPDRDSSKEYQYRLLGMMLLNLENHFDKTASEIAKEALVRAEAVKSGSLEASYDFRLDLEDDWN